MNTSFEEQIRERAYQIWLAGGMADGCAHEHWTSAEKAVLGETGAGAEPVVIITKAAPAAAKPRKAGTSKPTAAKVAKSKTKKSAH